MHDEASSEIKHQNIYNKLKTKCFKTDQTCFHWIEDKLLSDEVYLHSGKMHF